MTKLLGLQYRLVYKKGLENKVADELSLYPHDQSSELCAVSYMVSMWLEDIITGYEHDESTQRLMAQLAVNDSAVKDFQLRDGLLRYRGRIWVGDNEAVQNSILTTLHSSAIGGHLDFQVTYLRIRKLFA